MAAPGSFTAGSVLTAAEMNALPGGFIASDELTSDTAINTSETALLSFTASFTAGRNYLIGLSGFTYNASTTQIVYARIYVNSALVQQSAVNATTTIARWNFTQFVNFVPASDLTSVTVEGKFQTNTGTNGVAGVATRPAQLVLYGMGA